MNEAHFLEHSAQLPYQGRLFSLHISWLPHHRMGKMTPVVLQLIPPPSEIHNLFRYFLTNAHIVVQTDV